MTPRRQPTLANTPTLACLLMAVATAGCARPTWPQWGGPHRDFTVHSAALADAWPEQGPKQLWSRGLGDGFSTIVSDGRALFTMYRGQDDQEVIVALDPDTGKAIWDYRYPAPFKEIDKNTKHITKYGTGPNATPLIVGRRLFAVGFTGKMHCLDTSTGRVVWSKDLLDRMGGTFQDYGYAASPVAYGSNVIVLLGGQGQGIVAFDQDSGDIAWQSTDYDASYSSPIIVNVDGQDLLVAYMSRFLVGVSPETGREHWSLKHENQWGTSIATPLAGPDNLLYFVNGGDNAGGRVIRLSRQGRDIHAEDVWTNKKIRGGLNNPIRVGPFAYGPGGGRTGILLTFNFRSGEIVARQRGYPRSKALYADGKLIILDGDGYLTLAKPGPQGVETLARTQLL
ncbi:MAG: PQQ-binding-like beta-propeller repeat protein, partial [Phycisphaerae bacterium]